MTDSFFHHIFFQQSTDFKSKMGHEEWIAEAINCRTVSFLAVVLY